MVLGYPRRPDILLARLWHVHSSSIVDTAMPQGGLIILFWWERSL